jgi:tRNA-dihydrouridine synthase
LNKAAEIIRESGALFLGNGDVVSVKVQGVSSRDSASVPAELSWEVELKNGESINLMGKMDGVLIGRTAIGNPWALNRQSSIIDRRKRLEMAVEHIEKYTELFPGQPIFPIRKPLARYINGFDGAVDLRKRVMIIEEPENLVELLKERLVI